MKKEKYKISVIVPVYNKCDYLEQCLDSILQQTYQNTEILLVDDGSEDGSGEICERYAASDERVRVFHQPNGGPMAAVLTGMQNAEGDYYMFVDSDDHVSKEMLKEMAARLNGQRGEIVCCNHVLEKQKETVSVISPLKPGVYEGMKLQKEIKDKLIGSEVRIIPLSRCMKLCEKSVFEGNETYYDTKLRMGDDVELIYPALLGSRRIVIMEEALFYHYRYVEDSIVHGYNAGMAEDVETWYQIMERIVREKNVTDGEAALRREYCYMMMLVMKNELRNPGKNYVRRIQDIYMNAGVREKIVSTPVSIRNRSNALLYLGMQYPNTMLLKILRKIIKSYDKKGRVQS
ncbi:MAG: glycosyltransferase family 2 protein [Roseburia sp.]|nr:glycosyltransferase family 2 protein [Roseburia sp.]MCM1241598.1 glycosyltransferase family 2 protein [Roseburia sp.]